MIREAAISSMARVIFFVDSTDLIRARYSRRDTAMAQAFFFCLPIFSWSTSSSSRASCSSWPALIEPPSLVSNWSRNSS